MKQTKAQVWQLDFFIGIFLVLLAMGFFVQFTLEQTGTTQITDLSQSTSLLSQKLMTRGVPEFWDPATVTSIGILGTNSRVNNTKLFYLYNMSIDELRPFFTDRYRYTIQYLQDDVPIEIAGKTFVGFNSSEATSSFTITRYVLINSTITKLEVTLWQ